jgi:glutamyl-tRNA reductase
MMQIVVVGVNHKSCPIEMRERLAFGPDQLPAAYRTLQDGLGLPEALILSTCNRVEIYAGVPQPNGTVSRVSEFLRAHSRLESTVLEPALYRFEEPRSVEHLFAVASGLDSMVLGETDILHQVKHSYELARQYGMTGKTLNVLVQKALNAAKAVQQRTAVGRGCLSVGTVAIELAQKIFGDLRPYTALLVGAGKIGELVVQRLSERGVARRLIVNRSLERAQHLAQRYGGEAGDLSHLLDHLLLADIVLTSTASPEPLITRAALAGLMSRRRNRPLCLIDLGVPRNIEPAVGSLENVYLFNVDDLQGLVAHHHSQRREAVGESQAIVEQKLQVFLAWRDRERRRGQWSSAPAAAP